MAHIPVVERPGPPAEPAASGAGASPKGGPRRGLKPVAAALAVLVAAGLVLFALREPAVTPVAPPPAEPAPPGLLPPAADGGAGFAVEVSGLTTAALPGGRLTVVYDTFAVTALPGDTLTLRARYAASPRAQATGGTLAPAGPDAWTWTAPAEPGVSSVHIATASGDDVRLQAVTLAPFDHTADAIGDYAIGDYQDEPMNGDPVYDQPPGFVRVTPDLVDLPVSPHFRLGQFLAKQRPGPGQAEWPKYVALSAPLLVKLERLLAAVRAAGRPADGLTVMSGFRTPAYNAAIGNTTVYSRHLYGDAADVFVDADGDGVMDDLDGDGAVTRADAEWLAALVEGFSGEPWYRDLVGGLGVYDANAVRGPFVHVDVRGQPVRW